LKYLFFEIGKRGFIELNSICNDSDYLNILVVAEPKYPPSRVIQIIQLITARKSFEYYSKIINSYR